MKHRRRLFFKVLTLALVLSMGALLTVLYLMYSSLESVSSPGLSEISKITKLDFSKNVKLIGSEYLSSLDDSLYVAVEMTTDEIECLFPEERFYPSTSIRYLGNSNTRDRKWFNPDSIKKFKSFSYTDNANNSGMYVLYEDTDATARTVYILWFSF